ncbi:hypothetical protein ABZW18_16210 [Streptomyces sp. NPDC004647]|uniref:hypothetical protein n=1 Tax=Streptomyces sp. NPDC004647 TaxID=3154671 RepID=UPI0033B62B7E
MRRMTRGLPLHGRRDRAIASSAAALCLAALLAGCGGDGADDGYVAVGAVGPGSDGASARFVPPEGDVTLVPLDGRGDGSHAPGGGDRAAARDGGERTAGTSGPGDTPRGDGGGGERGGDGKGGRPGGRPGTGPGGGADDGSPGAGGTTGSGSGSGSGSGAAAGGGSGRPGDHDDGPADPAPPTPKPQTPASLSTGAPERTATDKRWCEKVTLELRNTGDRPVTSGTVTFGIHIIGALGTDWATIGSTRELPAPIDGGTRQKKTWTVCVDAWRVPLGMHIETQDVDVHWR